LSEWQEARSAQCSSIVSDEQRSHSPKLGLPKGQRRFWTAASSFIVRIRYSILTLLSSPEIQNRLCQYINNLCYRALEALLSGSILMKGTVYTLRRKCSKASCHCTRGALHPRIVLTASIRGRTQLWTIPEERIEEVRQKTEQYRRFRKARHSFIKSLEQRQRKMLRIIDSIERICIQQP
jgi:hypothetical protein